MNTEKEVLYARGILRARAFCAHNKLPEPHFRRVYPGDKYYRLGTCAFYRPSTIHVMVERCANKGYGGRAWSWPAYVIDRTPYGVIQHELGHHVDSLKYDSKSGSVFSHSTYLKSGEPPLTGYLGTDKKELTFYMEWFAEIFRLYVTNPDLCRMLRPMFFRAMKEAGVLPLLSDGWGAVLSGFGAPQRIIDQASKKIQSLR